MDDFLQRMFAASEGKNAANFMQQLAKRNIAFKPDRENLGWVNSDEPNTINLNDLYNPAGKIASPQMLTNNPRKALDTALHEMFHSQDFLNSRPIGQYNRRVDGAVHEFTSELAKQGVTKGNRWTPDYSPYTESKTRLRQEDMQLPQGQSILDKREVQSIIEDAYTKYHRPGWPGEPTLEGYKKGIQQAMYPEQRWIEPREPTIKEQISDSWDKFKDIFK